VSRILAGANFARCKGVSETVDAKGSSCRITDQFFATQTVGPNGWARTGGDRAGDLPMF
jgi:hypothetical protein